MAKWLSEPGSAETVGPAYRNGSTGVRPRAEVKVLDAAVYRRRIWVTLVVLTAMVAAVGVLALGTIAVSAGRLAGLLG